MDFKTANINQCNALMMMSYAQTKPIFLEIDDESISISQYYFLSRDQAITVSHNLTTHFIINLLSNMWPILVKVSHAASQSYTNFSRLNLQS